MNEFAKTGAFLGGAVLLWLLASLTGPREVSIELFSDEGQPLFPEFTDPAAATKLEVWEFREAGGEIVGFNVAKNDQGLWTIPSHGNYPADAKTRMAKSAAMLVGLKRDRVVSDRKEDHARFGVVDPKDENLELKGRGVHVTFTGKGDAVLADLIIGKAVEGKTDMHYVRLPDKKRVYVAKFDDQLSTKFADWIETDLLKAQSWDVSEVTCDNYSIDEQQRRIVEGDKIVARKDDASKWTLDGLKADEQPNEEKLRELGDTLGQLKIVGVRQKPPGLTGELKFAAGLEGALQVEDLKRKGFFPLRDGRLVSNEGELLFTTRKGIRYTLRFGEIAAGEGDELTSGKDAPTGDAPKAATPKPGEPKEKEGDKPASVSHRYLMVTAEFDESLLKKPTGARLDKDLLDKRQKARTEIEAIVKAVDAYKSKHENKLPESLAKLTEAPPEGGEPPLKELKKDPWDQDYVLQFQGDTFTVLSHGPDKQAGGEAGDADVCSDQLAKEDELKRVNDEWTAFDRKIEDGKKEGTSLTKRFGPWYYVIDAALFQKLKPQRADLVKPKDKPADAAANANPGTPAHEPGKQEPVK